MNCRCASVVSRGFALCLGMAVAVAVFVPGALSQSRAQEPDAQAASISISFSPEIAANNLVKKVDPVYPAIAKTARIQGTVHLKIIVSPEGNVSAVEYVDGPLLLMKAAIDAVKQWQYKPFSLDGKVVHATTTVDVIFSLGIPDAQYKAELKNNQEYFRLEGECRKLLRDHNAADAEKTCKAAIEAAEKLPKERQSERVDAYSLYGNALVSSAKATEALETYSHALAVAQSFLGPHDAELAYAYFRVAQVHHALGHFDEAQSNYESAVPILEQARENIGSDFLKNEYSINLEHILQVYISFLQQTGQQDKATKALERAKEISKDIHPCPESGDKYCVA